MPLLNVEVVASRIIAAGRYAVTAVLLLAVCVAAHAQGGSVDHTGTGGQHSIQGRILFPSGQRADLRIKVRLESAGSGDLSVLSDSNGSFSFRSLRPGYYTVVVEGGEEFETVREVVTIEPGSVATRKGTAGLSVSRPYSVQIYLQPKRESAPQPAPGVINAALAEVPRPALELYNKALESARKRENRKAVEQLNGALALHPNFPLALTQLGIQYMTLKEPGKAADALSSSLKLDPDDYSALLTYGIALYNLQKFSESEERLRQALAKNISSPSAHYYLGLLLVRRRDYDEAEKSFLEAARHGGDEMARAHKYLGGIYWERGDLRRAVEQLETYLRLSPDAEDAARVRATVKDLRAKL